MYLISLFVFVLGLTISSPGEVDIRAVFDADVIEKCNTAKDADYLTEEEKEIVLILNLVRTEPKKFRDEVLIQYTYGTDMDKSSYYGSLLRELNKAPTLGLLMPNKTLFKEAVYHAAYTGEKGKVGHKGPKGKSFNSRMKPLMRTFTGVGENCHYGFNQALDIVIQLLIDLDVPSLGHRKNILNKDFKYVGTSIKPHKKYMYTCVMDFGGDLQ